MDLNSDVKISILENEYNDYDLSFKILVVGDAGKNQDYLELF